MPECQGLPFNNLIAIIAVCISMVVALWIVLKHFDFTIDLKDKEDEQGKG